MIRRTLALIVAAVVLSAADDPALHLKDPEQEARARALFQEIRCVVCQNETIAGSNALPAQTMRQVVREQIAAGKSDREVKDYLYERYGDFILLRPRFNARNAFLWVLPFAIVVIGGGAIILRRKPPEAEAPPQAEALSPEELAALEALAAKSQQKPPV